MRYKQYSVVKLKKIFRRFDLNDLKFDKRHPQVGDEATIVEVYESPTLGYELECSDKNGVTEWLVTFSPEDAEFDVIDEG